MSDIDCYEFDGFRFYVNGGYLTHDEDPIPIQPKTAQVLTVLLRNNGVLVSRDTFAAEAWKLQFLSEGSLSNQISALRKIFERYGDTYIKTEPKRGYRFESIVRPCSGSHDGTLVDCFDRYGFFEDYTPRFSELFTKTNNVVAYFIHSRRWRENHRHELNAFLAKPDARLTVFLPNLDNKVLMDGLRADFLDGPSIPHWTKEAYQDFAEYYFNFPGKVSVRRYDHYPTYSFYLFDEVLIAAMYPTVIARRQVPTLELSPESPYWTFFKDDRKILLKIKELSKAKLAKIRSNK